ncbi:MAG: D-alanyl-D-alanine carboxypeptidase [Alphaproteobacteria bacterium]|nr:D-alanyl-D-alanine carboxypeptidase [Alphaproteobacteria bacterium]
MVYCFCRPLGRFLPGLLLVTATLFALPHKAAAEALLLIEADSGKVLQAENATVPWHPASVTKIMTAYVTLNAVKKGRVTLDSLLTVSALAYAQSPSKMGFRPGTRVTIDNALKMMMVKSANDMAVALAEGVGGSVDNFATMMNQTAQSLGMTQTHYVNPNGLPADEQITSARDLAILSRAFIRDLPEYEYFVHIPAIRFGGHITPNFNTLIGRYAGADGFKTGFICASGYNLVASATRNGRRLIAVVLGAPSSTGRAVKAMQLLDRGFSPDFTSWLQASPGTVDQLAPTESAPPDLHDQMCSGRHNHAQSDDPLVSADASDGQSPATSLLTPPQMIKASDLLAAPPQGAEPLLVYTGPTRTGEALVAAEAADAAWQSRSHRHGRKSRAALRRGGKAHNAGKAHAATGKPEAGSKKPAAAKQNAHKPAARSAAAH